MCSIAGLIAKDASLNAEAGPEIARLLDGMHHRGPDARGVKRCSERVMLGSNRLRITDAFNPQADMPMTSADGNLTIVFNGEIYNHRELRRELQDYPFRTQSDTEVLLAAYRKWGKGCLDRLEGMYAFCIHDARADTSLIACDPTGQKTAYIYEDKDAIVFASEIDPLIASPFRHKDWDLDGLSEFVAHRFILGSQTHIRQIRKLESGTCLTISPEGQKTERFYKVPVGDQARHDADRIGDDIAHAVTQGCRRTFDLEVPYALLLSGGIDSTAVLAEARRHGLALQTFSIGFQPAGSILKEAGSVFDEFEYSRMLASQYHTRHEEITLTAADYCNYLDKWASIAGEPMGSQEAPCLIKLFEHAGRQAKVVFSGSGPDELFDGYSYGKKLAGIPLSGLPEQYFDSFRWTGDTDLSRLMPNHDSRKIATGKYRDTLSLYEGQIDDPLQAVQLVHFHGRLNVYEFRQMDLISMRHSVEARAPLADTGLVARAFDFDPALKQRHGEEKGIYKHALRNLVPAVIGARKKQGFPIPAEMWRSAAFEERARILFEPGAVLTGTGLIDKAYLHDLWESPDHATRNIFSRLYTAESILRRQAPLLEPVLAAVPGLPSRWSLPSLIP
ncbi:MAG: asparagine synthase (glutamine-hydrolyzing) [Alphaproteobacteria bacterium]